MKLYLSQRTQDPTNTIYQTEKEIHTIDDLRAAVIKDHIAGEMNGSYRGNENFKKSDCVMLDLDNTHSNDPAEWKDIDDITDAFPDVAFYYIQSRNHMKEKRHTAKDGTVTYYEPRPKYHIYFPLSRTITDRGDYERLMIKAAGLFPFFDLGAAKPAQFFYGVHDPAGGLEKGDLFLDGFMADQSAEIIAAAIRDFAAKVKDGTYRQTKETQKAISRLYSFLGISQESTPQEPTAGQSQRDVEEYSGFGQTIAETEQRQRIEWLKQWANKYGVALGKAYKIRSREHPGAICICVSCPWEDDHTMNGAENEAVIMIELGGKIGFLCRHSHGYMYSWRDYRAYYEARGPQNEPQGPRNTADDKNTAGNQESHTGAIEWNGEIGGGADQKKSAEPLPGLLTFDAIAGELKEADDETIMIKSFPVFSKVAKIKKHSTVVIAADTGGGKSSLSINFMNGLNEEYPCIYFNLEMDRLTALRRLIAIHSGIELDRIEGYKYDEETAAAVNVHIRAITGRKPLQIIQDIYSLEKIEDTIRRSTAGREEPTMVFIDHSLLVEISGRTSGRYERFTIISEQLRKMALRYNVVLFVLLQQNREGKANEDARPKNSSLKESGSWENDSTHIIFLWYDPEVKKKKLLLTKNRGGDQGEFVLNYWKKTQTYMEAIDQDQGQAAQTTGVKASGKKTNREKAREKLQKAYDQAIIATNGHPTIKAIAEAADVRTATVKGWIREYGGCIVDGKPIEPAGIDAEVELTGFIKLAPGETSPFDDTENNGSGQRITASF